MSVFGHDCNRDTALTIESPQIKEPQEHEYRGKIQDQLIHELANGVALVEQVRREEKTLESMFRDARDLAEDDLPFEWTEDDQAKLDCHPDVSTTWVMSGKTYH